MAGLFRQFAQDSTQDVWPRGQIARAEAIADLFDGERGHEAEALRELDGDRGAGWCDEFVGLVDLTQGNPTEDLKRGGSGDGESAVGAFHGAVSVMEPAAENLSHAECLQPDAREDDVGDAVEGADFVEVNGFRILAMNLSFSDGDPVKNRDGVFLGELGEFAPFDERADLGISPTFIVMMMLVAVLVLMMLVRVAVRVFVGVRMLVLVRFRAVVVVTVVVSVLMLILMMMPVLVMMMLAVGMLVSTLVVMFIMVVIMMTAALVMIVVVMRSAAVDVEFHALDVLPLRTIVVHVEIAKAEFAELPFEAAWFHPEINERADHHVAADSGNAVQVESFHAENCVAGVSAQGKLRPLQPVHGRLRRRFHVRTARNDSVHAAPTPPPIPSNQGVPRKQVRCIDSGVKNSRLRPAS